MNRLLLFKWESWYYRGDLIPAVYKENYAGADELLDYVLQLRVANLSLPSISVDSLLKAALTRIQDSLSCTPEAYAEYKKKNKILGKYGVSIPWKAAEQYEKGLATTLGLFGAKSIPEVKVVSQTPVVFHVQTLS